MGGLRAHYQTRTLTGLEFTPVQYQDAYWQADAYLTYNFPNDRLSITGYINNMFDETVFTNSFPVPFGLFNTATLRPPRTYGVRVGAKF